QSMPRHSCLPIRSVAVEEEADESAHAPEARGKRPRQPKRPMEHQVGIHGELGEAGRTRPAKRSIRYRDPSKPRPRLPKGAADDVALSWSRAVKRAPEEPATPL
ncbi:hypothetical protein MAPG_08775, partial [Magnaporthiopsis poae ATCC 64411]